MAAVNIHTFVCSTVILFQQGQLCSKLAAALCCWIDQSILVRTKENRKGPAGPGDRSSTEDLNNNPNLVAAACRIRLTEHECAAHLIYTGAEAPMSRLFLW